MSLKPTQKVAGKVFTLPAASAPQTLRTSTDALNGNAKPHESFHFARHRWLAAVARDKKITGAVLSVAVLLWEHMNAERGCAWPSLVYIATQMKLDRSTVVRAVAKLEARCWIVRNRRGGRFRSNEYRLAFGST